MSNSTLYNKLDKLYSKESVSNVAKSIKTKTETRDLVCYLSDSNEKIANRAAWVLSHSYNLKNPHIVSFKNELITILFQTKSDAIKRNIFRTFQFEKIPKKHESQFFDFSLKVLINPKDKVAAKAFALSSLLLIAVKYPELKNELILTCNEVLPTASKGLKNKLLKTLQELQ